LYFSAAISHIRCVLVGLFCFILALFIGLELGCDGCVTLKAKFSVPAVFNDGDRSPFTAGNKFRK